MASARDLKGDTDSQLLTCGAALLHNRLLYLNSVLRAERIAAALRFARSTVGQICKTLQSETMGDTGFEPATPRV